MMVSNILLLMLKERVLLPCGANRTALSRKVAQKRFNIWELLEMTSY